MLITGMHKKNMYVRMAYLLRMHRDDCHVGYFDYGTCVRARRALSDDLLKLTADPA